MGQKVNPNGFRVGIISDWNTQWYANKKDFGKFLLEDYKIREFVKKKYYACGIPKITIERSTAKVTVNVFTSKPGVLIGVKGAGVEQLKKEISDIVKSKPVSINVMEVKRPDMDATLIAESVAAQLEKRMSFRRVMKQAMGRAMRQGAKGIKINCGGRLDGAEIARSEHYHEGALPLQTLRADIDFGTAEANTTFGKIGVKVWVYKGEILPEIKQQDNK